MSISDMVDRNPYDMKTAANNIMKHVERIREILEHTDTSILEKRDALDSKTISSLSLYEASKKDIQSQLEQYEIICAKIKKNADGLIQLKDTFRF